MNPQAFQELLSRIRASQKTKEDVDAISSLQSKINAFQPQTIDLSLLGVTPSTDWMEVADILQESLLETRDAAPQSSKTIGVARDVTLNDKQQLFLDTALAGKSVVLIGAAGTGKTTSMRKTTRALIDGGNLGTIHNSTKYLAVGSPGAAILSYTRKAVNNIRHAVVEELKGNTLTIHKLLEFAPVFYEIEDSEHPGNFKKTMRFEPSRCATNPLPSELRLIVIEESSMVSTELYDQLQDALPHEHQEIFLGDIQQLPPVFGMAILGFKMNTLPVIELTEVYRQALESPIIALAWKILGGNPDDFSPRTESYDVFSTVLNRTTKRLKVPSLEALSSCTEFGEVKFQPWQKQLSSDHGLITSAKQFTAWADQGYYNPEDDIILCPFNKALGTVELNKFIAQYLGVKRDATVYEVIAGFNVHYLAVGDRVLYDKEDAYITEIRPSADYLGKRTQPASLHLDRWGQMQEKLTEEEYLTAQSAEFDDKSVEALEKFMEMATGGDEERVQAASHTIVIRYAYDMQDASTTREDDSSNQVILKSASEINALLGGYAITVHKSQGSEYDRVFLLLHQSHATMVSRELLYTAVTRAKKFIHIICEVRSFYNGVKSQRVKGDTIAEKAEFFKGKATEREKQQEELKLVYEAAGSVLSKSKVVVGKQENWEDEAAELPPAESIKALVATAVTEVMVEESKIQKMLRELREKALPTAQGKETRMESSTLVIKEADEIDEIIEDAQLCPRLTQWEATFVESVAAQWTAKRSLSDKQREILNRIASDKVYIS